MVFKPLSEYYINIQIVDAIQDLNHLKTGYYKVRILYISLPESKDVSGFEEQVVVAHVISMAVSANNKVNVIL